MHGNNVLISYDKHASLSSRVPLKRLLVFLFLHLSIFRLCRAVQQPPTKYLLPEASINDYGKNCVVIDLDETLVHSSFKVPMSYLYLEYFSILVVCLTET